MRPLKTITISFPKKNCDYNNKLTDKVRDDLPIRKLAVGIIPGFTVRPEGLSNRCSCEEEPSISSVEVGIPECEQCHRRYFLARDDDQCMKESKYQ